MKINKYFPFFALFFFFNSVFLPLGLVYTTLLIPLFYLWLKIKGKDFIITRFLLPFIPFLIIHFINGVEELIYLKSLTLLFTTYVTVYAFYTLAQRMDYMGLWFKKITIINAILTLVGVVFFFTPYIDAFWTVQNLSVDVRDFPRLSLLTYEPSYYSTLLVPVVAYFLLDTLLRNKWASLSYLCLLMVPFILSFSLGVMACLVFAFFMMILIHNRAITVKRVNLRPLMIALGIGVLSFGAWMVVDTDNPLAVRVGNVLAGKDQSGRGRTNEAFLLSYRIANEKSLAWGAGVGQVKVLGEKIIRPFYRYTKADVPTTAIPCAAAETLAVFGFIGLALRILIQFYLFYKCRVLDSSFRTLMFIYMFIYQFTGSFLTNLAEYFIWVLVFVPCFMQFEKPREQEQAVALT